MGFWSWWWSNTNDEQLFIEHLIEDDSLDWEYNKFFERFITERNGLQIVVNPTLITTITLGVTEGSNIIRVNDYNGQVYKHLLSIYKENEISDLGHVLDRLQQ